MRQVVKFYRGRGYEVSSVERDRTGYDLLCMKGRAKLFVEVKGVRGSRRSFFMTRRELSVCTENPRFILALVTRALSARALVTPWSAREFLEQFDATPATYSVRFVGGREAL